MFIFQRISGFLCWNCLDGRSLHVKHWEQAIGRGRKRTRGRRPGTAGGGKSKPAVDGRRPCGVQAGPEVKELDIFERHATLRAQTQRDWGLLAEAARVFWWHFKPALKVRKII